MQKLARIISSLFIPPTFTLISFLYLATAYESQIINKIIIISTALIFGFILQLVSFFIFFKKGYIEDVDAKIKNERTLPYIISILIFIFGLIVFLIFAVNKISIAFWFCYISNTFLVVFINNYFKISIHMMGAAGPLALFCFTVGFGAMVFLPIIIIIGWSRIKLEVHSLAEVIFGALVGFASVYFQLALLLN